MPITLPPDGPSLPATRLAPAASVRPRLLDAVPVFRYVTADNAPNYRALLEVFVEAKERYLIELRPANVRRFLYRLTPASEAAHRAGREVEATVGRSGALQTSMLVEVRDALGALVAAAGAGDAPSLTSPRPTPHG